jgi:hypothetical protein
MLGWLLAKIMKIQFGKFEMNLENGGLERSIKSFPCSQSMILVFSTFVISTSKIHLAEVT